MPTAPDSFAEFRESFYYGSRSDMNFKFLKNLDDEQAADFLQTLLRQIGDAHDSQNWDAVIAHVQSAQARAYAGPSRFTHDDGPFTPLPKPVAHSRIALFTSSGHFVAGDDPKPFGLEAMTQAEAEARVDDFLKDTPALSHIPVDTPKDQLRVRHPGYDIRGALADSNVVFPLDRMGELAAAGVMGTFHPTAYSFVGASAQTRLTKRLAPAWAADLLADGVEAVVLVPV
ncbi:MAG: hypothetical protein KBG20_10460 [Caldilineaceae bacterium]|nr:hypothetical protein [Caldilineaceae bacterium]MBP8106404.1 hypothetical protein [Caldilineaceae bacterium]MBP8121413.1 hypothetical protein [Caldilineaceae bacterium]MBP9072715.1 hypothetical protein [Caldilineaceae bacterium]